MVIKGLSGQLLCHLAGKGQPYQIGAYLAGGKVSVIVAAAIAQAPALFGKGKPRQEHQILLAGDCRFAPHRLGDPLKSLLQHPFLVEGHLLPFHLGVGNLLA